MPIQEQEQQLKDIQQTINGARLEFQAGNLSHEDYLRVVRQCDRNLKQWSEVVNERTEHIPSGQGTATHPKRNDPFFKLHQQALAFILDVRAERREMEARTEGTNNVS
jgi:hypothetical protein